MKTLYTISDIAGELRVNEVSVRRWVRSGKLIGKKTSDKGGYFITAEDYMKFRIENPKYYTREEEYRTSLRESVIREFYNLLDGVEIDAYSNRGEHGKVYNDGYFDCLREIKMRLSKVVEG